MPESTEGILHQLEVYADKSRPARHLNISAVEAVKARLGQADALVRLFVDLPETARKCLGVRSRIEHLDGPLKDSVSVTFGVRLALSKAMLREAKFSHREWLIAGISAQIIDLVTGGGWAEVATKILGESHLEKCRRLGDLLEDSGLPLKARDGRRETVERLVYEAVLGGWRTQPLGNPLDIVEAIMDVIDRHATFPLGESDED